MDNSTAIITIENEMLHQGIAAVWNEKDTTTHLNRLVNQANHLKIAFQAIGDDAALRLDVVKNAAPASYKTSFQWAEQAKGFLILWRDILLEQQKGYILQLDTQISPEQLQQHRLEAETITTQAFQSLIDNLRDASIPDELVDWKLQQNPWSTYREQLEQLDQQCQEIVERGKTLQETQVIYQNIHNLVLDNLTLCKNDVQDISDLLQTTLEFFKTETTISSIQQLGKINNKVQELRNTIKVPNHKNTFVSHFDILLESLPTKLQVPVETNGGSLVIREIAFQRDSKQWLGSEITPLLYDIWEITEGIINGMKMILINMRNQVAVLSAQLKENQTIAKNIATHSVISFENKIQVAQEKLNELGTAIHKRLDKGFKIAYIYNTDQPFLPTQFQSSLTNLPLGTNNLPTWIKQWTSQQNDRIQQLRQRLDYEKSLSTSEKIVRFIKNRKRSDIYYADIFLTSGYVGESFWIGRKSKLKRAEVLIENWRQGYRGSILLTGKRLSGKSLFGEKIANNHFGQKIIRLFPDSTLKLNGRKLEIGYDLEKALALIKNNTLNTQTLVWIDNLELWWDINIPLNRNVRALTKAIDSSNNQLFFMVAMSDWLKAHLNTYHHLNRVFQAEIKMDKMPLNEIEQAIDIRHGATHKELIDTSGILTPTQFKKAVKPVYQHTNGNIGESLYLWTASIHEKNESKVTYKFRATHNLPEFLNTDMATLLTSIILQKRTNEYRLRKLFGPAFSTTYIGIIKRLLGIGILQKRLDDWIQVNETIVNPLAEMLVQKKYLKNS